MVGYGKVRSGSGRSSKEKVELGGSQQLKSGQDGSEQVRFEPASRQTGIKSRREAGTVGRQAGTPKATYTIPLTVTSERQGCGKNVTGGGLWASKRLHNLSFSMALARAGKPAPRVVYDTAAPRSHGP